MSALRAAIIRADRLRLAVALVVTLLLVWPVFARGLYSHSVQYWAFWNATIALAGVCALGRLERRPFTVTPVRLAAVGFWVAYVLSLTVAVAPREAVQEVMKYGLYLMVLLSVSEIVHSGKVREGRAGVAAGQTRVDGPAGLARVVWGSVVVLGLISLLGAVGLLPFEAARDGRLFTLLGYPNSAGSLAGAALFLGLGLRPAPAARERPWRLALHSAGQWVLATTFLLTMSRGAWLVAPVALVVTLALWTPGRRLTVLGDVALTCLGAVLVAPFLGAAFGQPALGLALLLAGAGVGLGTSWVYARFAVLPCRAQATLAGVIVLAAVLALGGLLVAKALPAGLAQRLTTISLSERSAWERVAWTQDAFSMVKDRPVLGAGGGGWASLYFQYQSYDYATGEVHNDFLEIWVETGTVGILAFLALLAATAWALVRLGRGGFIASLAGAAVLLVLHSALDFDMALGYVGIILWSLFGIIDGLGAASRRPASLAVRAAQPARVGAAQPARVGAAQPARVGAAQPVWVGAAQPVWVVAALLTPAFILSLVALCFAAGTSVGRQAGRLFGSAVRPDQLSIFDRASALDPLSPALRLNAGRAYGAIYQLTGQAEFLDTALAAYEKAVALDPFYPYHHSALAGFELEIGRWEPAAAEFEKALELQPWKAQRYAEVAQARLLYGLDLLRRGDAVMARGELDETVAVLDLLRRQAAKLPPGLDPSLGLPPLVPSLALYAGEASTLLGRYDQAAVFLLTARETALTTSAGETPASAADRQVQAALWLAVVESALGHEAAARAYLDEARPGFPRADEIRLELISLLGGP